jgi:predicted methyltransferase
MRLIWTGVAAVALASGASAAHHSARQTHEAVAAALADRDRADQVGDDARRQAAAALEFSGVGPGDVVIDFLPGNGYWTRLFTKAVGPYGHVYAVWPQAAARFAEKALPALEARHMANVTLTVLQGNGVTAPEPADLVWTVQNYHDVNNTPAGEAAIDGFNAQVFKALKPGGTYVVIDHADADGTGLSGTSTKHRVDPAAVKAEVVKAGFQFVGESAALRNPADDHSLKVFDPAIRGHTDQFMYKFRKP